MKKNIKNNKPEVRRPVGCGPSLRLPFEIVACVLRAFPAWLLVVLLPILAGGNCLSTIFDGTGQGAKHKRIPNPDQSQSEFFRTLQDEDPGWPDCRY